jgi:hypothetical protein
VEKHIDENESRNEDISFGAQEFSAWCEENEIDHDELAMDDDECKDFLKIKSRFIKAVKEKRLIVDGAELKYTISKFSQAAGEKITLSRPKGRDFMAMDGFKDTQQMQKLNAFIASMAGKEKSWGARLDVTDQRFLQDIAALFLTA